MSNTNPDSEQQLETTDFGTDIAGDESAPADEADTEPELCGEETRDGTPCEIPRDSCPHHHNRNGWPRLLAEREEEILKAAKIGKTKEGCARSAGVSKQTLYEWLDRFPDFADGFKRARAEGENRLVARTWERKPEFILERSFGYTKSEEVTHRHEDAVPIDAPASVIRIESSSPAESDGGDD
ncbi:hypothetical protein [Halomarina pelagica]|uniref:hypothetical protein n=1 Tax=Halomarina pelagica TaxID=2961599 RepID=UPI0020C25636|nr:hypothetical protein [Halomarina sp. BND7]